MGCEVSKYPVKIEVSEDGGYFIKGVFPSDPGIYKIDANGQTFELHSRRCAILIAASDTEAVQWLYSWCGDPYTTLAEDGYIGLECWTFEDYPKTIGEVPLLFTAIGGKPHRYQSYKSAKGLPK